MKVCLKCGIEHSKPGLYCSRSCANSRVWSKEDKLRKSIAAKNSERVKEKNKERKCKRCGAVKGQCKHPDVCKKHQILPSLVKYFGFNEKVMGTEQFYKEFERVKNILVEDYIINELSTLEIQKKISYKSYNNFNKILKSLNINRRTLSDAGKIPYKKGKLDRYRFIDLNKSTGHPQYKSCYHTTWNNKKVFLRSSYELDYAKQLDKEQVDYEVEKLRILYWDSQLLKQRIAIPDFYLTQTNTIVEIKSNYTLNEQNMKDKLEAYSEHGYKFKLILNKVETLFS